LAVANYYANTFTDNVTVNIAVGFGEVAGQTLASGALGESLTYFTSTTYSRLTSALKADALTTDDHNSAASLPASDPTGGGHYFLTTANAKALGLYGGSGLDGYVGFSKTAAMDYDASNGVSAGTYDFFGVVAHEFSEIMGRELLTGETLGSTAKSFTALDLFHYVSAGVRTFSGATAGYFSTNGGATHLQSFNTNSHGDFGDWSSTAGADAFDAFSSGGVVNKITAGDLAALDVIGWNRGASTSTTTATTYPASTTVHLAAGQSVAQLYGHAAGGYEPEPNVTAHDASFAENLLSVGRSLQNGHLVSVLDAFYAA
jgi:hypothetical protein